jgi:hypothetical protein
MKRQCLWLCTLFALTLFTSNYARAQKDTTFWMTLLEYRVHDESIFEKNYPTVRSYWLKANEGVEYNRAAHTSESGRIYGMAFFKGADAFGKFMATRVKISDAFAKDNAAMSKENNKNINGAITRSVWIRMDSLSSYEAGYKMENYDFRKVQLISVNPDKINEFKATLFKLAALDASHGIKYNFIVFRCTDGYPSNTFILALPDKSLMDYYKNRAARESIRDKDKSTYDPLNKAMGDMSLIIRIDHLTRVKI